MASQGSRALVLCSYFLSGCLAINASQFLAIPLYFIEKNWYESWIAFTKQSFGLLTITLTQAWAPTVVRVSGGRSVRGQLTKTVDGDLLCNFPDRLILMANHQIYTDWLYMWWIAYANVIGWGMQMSQFIFLKRNWEKDKDSLATHLQKLNIKSKPMWLMIFPEGTNLAPCTREASKKWADRNGFSDMQHGLIPRTTGLQFCLQQLKETTDFLYDCTIAYEGVKHGQYAQDVFTLKTAYFQGKPPKSVNMYWRRFKISEIPLHDSVAFEKWLRNRWIEKDKLIELYLRTGRFPADHGVDKDVDGKIRRGIGHVEAEIKPFRWYEFLQVFAPLGVLAMVLFMFYGSLPTQIVRPINKRIMMKNPDVFAQRKQETQIGNSTLPAANSVNGQHLPSGPVFRPLHTTKQILPLSRPPKLSRPALGPVADKVNTAASKAKKTQFPRGSKPQKLEVRNHKPVQGNVASI